MYVCIEVALRGDAHEIGRSNWAKGSVVFLFGINSALVVTAHHALFSFPMLAFSLLV